MEFIQHPGESTRVGDWLKDNLQKDWSHFRAAVAFVKRSGTRHIHKPLAKFAETSHVEIVVGIDHQGSSYEGLLDLIHAVSPSGKVVVFHNRLAITFHPKIYLFKSKTAAEVIVGSGNLTEGGLFANYEAALRLEFNLAKRDQVDVLRSIENTLDQWANAQGTSWPLNAEFLGQLRDLSLVSTEGPLVSKDSNAAVEETQKGTSSFSGEMPFAARSERRAPSTTRSATATGVAQRFEVGGIPTLRGQRFLMTLQQTDVGTGQTTAGTSRRSPEIFVPLAARNANPTFWNWPDSFVQDETKPGKYDHSGVRMRLGDSIVLVNMMTWPDRHDFRLRSEALRSAGGIGDILRIEKVNSESGFDYFVEVIPQGTKRYAFCFSKCTQLVRNSRKRFGYY